jgi:hypothetical protein
VTIQGMEIRGSSGATGDGIRCATSTTKSTLTVLESTIQINEGLGVKGADCDVVLRRNRIESNLAGGVKLDSGTFVVVNNLVVNNGQGGTTGSGVGGFDLNTGGGTNTVTFVNNTVADNSALNGAASSINCSSPYNVSNSIIWGITDPQISSCTVSHSDVLGGATGGTNIDTDPNFDMDYKPQAAACHDSGDDNAADISKIDLNSEKRIQGSQVDMGAYEIK